MAVTKPPQQAISEFAEAIAQHYLAAQQGSEHQDPDSVAEEFVSAIETDLKSTLRHRLSQLETEKQAIETPTVDLPRSAVDLEQSRESLDYDGLQPTMDSGGEVSEPSASAIETPTMDTSVGSQDNEPTMDSEPAASASVRAGTSTPSLELSFDSEAQQRGAKQGPEAPPEYQIISTLGKGGSHGLGIGIYLDPVRRGVLSSPGELEWGGIYQTIYWWDPVEDVILVSMLQLAASPWQLRFRDDLSVAIYQARTEISD